MYDLATNTEVDTTHFDTLVPQQSTTGFPYFLAGYRPTDVRSMHADDGLLFLCLGDHLQLLAVDRCTKQVIWSMRSIVNIFNCPSTLVSAQTLLLSVGHPDDPPLIQVVRFPCLFAYPKY